MKITLIFIFFVSGLPQYKIDLMIKIMIKIMRMLKQDTRDIEKYVACLDLQQQISLPTLTYSRMYYSRQLSCYIILEFTMNADVRASCAYGWKCTEVAAPLKLQRLCSII